MSVLPSGKDTLVIVNVDAVPGEKVRDYFGGFVSYRNADGSFALYHGNNHDPLSDPFGVRVTELTLVENNIASEAEVASRVTKICMAMYKALS